MNRLSALAVPAVLLLSACSAVGTRPVEVTKRSASPDASACGNHCFQGEWPDYTKATTAGAPAMKIDRWRYRIEGLAPDYSSIKLTDEHWVTSAARVSNFHYRYQIYDAGKNLLWDSGEMSVPAGCTAGPTEQRQTRTPHVAYSKIAFVEVHHPTPEEVVVKGCND